MSYILSIASVILGLLALVKDWKTYSHRWTGFVVGLLIVLVGAGSIVKQRLDKNEALAGTTRAESNIRDLKIQIAGLKGHVQAANEAQTRNATVFTSAFSELSGKLHELQTKVTTEDLRRQLAGVQNDLQKTQKALAPPPKATLSFSFLQPPGKEEEPARSTWLSRGPDGNVHVEFTMINLTEATASDGQITLSICDKCWFLHEPEGFTRLPNTPETERVMEFARILPRTRLPPIAVDIVPPRKVPYFEVGTITRCRNCSLETANSRGLIHIR